MRMYENYHCHTFYSNCLTQPDSTMSIEDYAKIYRERGQQVLCMSEHGNRSNVWEQSEVATKYSNDTFRMKPIAAAEVYFVPDRNPEKQDRRNFHLILIAKNMTGFYELNEILSEANVSGYYYHARVDFDLLSRVNPRNFICTTACVGGVLKDEEHGLDYCLQLNEIFRENFYLEIQHHPQPIQMKHNTNILKIYKQYKIPLIYGTDSHYIRHEDAVLRKELLLSSGIKNGYEDEFDLFLPTPDEAYELLARQKIFSPAQIEEAMENTLILRDCEPLHFTTERKFPVSRPELTQEQRNYLYQKMVCDGYIEKEGMPSPEEAKELRAEMNTIIETGSADYFIGLHDMLKRGQELGGVLTTTSRGSACGYASNYALGFTSINRLHSPVKMYPERFISKAKLQSGAMPDIDSNIANLEAFEQAGREIFGPHSCYPMIAYGKTKVLSAFKLLARARNIDFDLSNKVSKQIQQYELDRKHALENNQDDPDYNVDDEIKIHNYVSAEYLPLIADSSQYQNIIVSISPHPCAHLVYHHDLRREIGIIRTKAKSGAKEPVYCTYIDGTTADNYGYCKSDLLRVDVVKIINDTFKAIGQPVMSAEELVKRINEEPEIWKLYANGYTMGLNQTEREKTTERVMRFKPKNTVELAAFIAAIRPGAKSLVDGFVAREFHNYQIPAMDKLLLLDGATGITGKSSFLFYDEQVMTLAKAAGIPPADANALIKAIKKKKLDKVAAYKDRFVPGFVDYLIQQEHTDQQLAEKTADDVWTVILNSASYLFNASHAYAMCLDSLYGAYLKYHAPYEFYVTLLKLYTEKGNKEKIAKIISEMKRYKNISISLGKFGQDNRDWLIDKENRTISQSLSSIKFISKKAAKDLLDYGQKHYDTFTDLLRELQTNTCLNTRQIKILITLGYFSSFGGSAKLTKVFDSFFEGKNKLTKTLVEKSVEKRIAILRDEEASLPDEELPLAERIKAEFEYMGLCFTVNPDAANNLYFVTDVDDRFGIKVTLYHVKRGVSGLMKLRRDDYLLNPLHPGECIAVHDWTKRQKKRYKDGVPMAIPGEYEIWLRSWAAA